MKKRRILAMVLSAALAVTAVPVSVFGEEADALLEDEVLVEEAAPVEEVAEPVEAAPEEAPVEEAAPVDELIIEDAEEPQAEDGEVPAETEAPKNEAEPEFIDILGEEEAGEEEQVENAADTKWTPNILDIHLVGFQGSDHAVRINAGDIVDAGSEGEVRLDGKFFMYYDPFTHQNGIHPEIDEIRKRGGNKYAKNVDYSIEYGNNTNAKEATDVNAPYIKIWFIGTYEDITPIKIYYHIAPYPLDSPLYNDDVIITLKGDGLEYTYNGEAQHPKVDEVDVTIKRDGYQDYHLKSDEYIVPDVYFDGAGANEDYYVNAGENKQVTVEGVGNFTDRTNGGNRGPNTNVPTFDIKPVVLTNENWQRFIEIPVDQVYYVHGPRCYVDLPFGGTVGQDEMYAAWDTYPVWKENIHDVFVGSFVDKVANKPLVINKDFSTSEYYTRSVGTLVDKVKWDIVQGNYVHTNAKRTDVGVYTANVFMLDTGNFRMGPGLTLTGKFEIKLHPELPAIAKQIQELYDDTARGRWNIGRGLNKSLSDRLGIGEWYYYNHEGLFNEFFEYYGDDKWSGMNGLIHSWLDYYWEDGADVDLHDVDMTRASNYTITFEGTNSGRYSDWGTGSFDINVSISPRNLQDHVSRTPKLREWRDSATDPNAVDYPSFNDYFEYRFDQFKHSDDTYEDGYIDTSTTPSKYVASFLTIKDHGRNPGPTTLKENEDYTAVPNRKPNGKVTDATITGRNNYTSMLDGEVVDIPLVNNNEPHQIPFGSTLFIQVRLTDEAIDMLNHISGSDLEGGKVPELKPEHFIVEEINSVTKKVIRTLASTEYDVVGYDDPITKNVPHTAGYHTAWLQFNGTGPYPDIYTTNAPHAVPYEIKGTPFKDEYTYFGTIPTQQPLVDTRVVDAGLVPRVKKKSAGPDEDYELREKFDYYYFVDSDGDGEMDRSEMEAAKAAGLYVDGDWVNLPAQAIVNFPKGGDYYLGIVPNRGTLWEGDAEIDDSAIVVPFKVDGRSIEPDTSVTFDGDTTIEWPGHNVTTDDFEAALEFLDVGKNVKYVMKPGTDYTLTLEPNAEMSVVGDATLVVHGAGEYTGEKRIPVKVVPRDISDGKVTFIRHEAPYAQGKSYALPSDVVRVDLFNPTDTVPENMYTVTFLKVGSLDVGVESELKIDGTVNYTGTLKTSDKIKIVPGDVSDTSFFEVRGVPDDSVYTGSAKYTKGTATLWNKLTNEEVPKDAYEEAATDDNYTDAGSHDIVLTVKAGNTNYVGSATGSFNIAQADNPLSGSLAAVTVDVGKSAKIAVPSNAQGDLSFKVEPAGLVTFADGNAVGAKPGTGTITVTAAGNKNYKSGSATAALTVNAVATPIDDFVIALPAATYKYTGKAIEPVPTVTSKDGKALVKGTDFTVSYADNTNVGVATYTIQGIGDYTGTVAGTFAITPADNAIKVKTSAATKYYSAAAQTTTKLAGATATSGAVTYSSDNPDMTVNPTTGAITIKAKAMGRATITITAANPNYQTATAKVTLTVQPKKVKLQSVKNSKGKAKLTWTKAPACSGYVVKLSSAKTFKSDVEYVWVKKENASGARFIKHMQKGKTYYFKVKVYQNITGQKKVYSVYSNVKSLKIK